ncbi:MAG: hypothetical protein OXC60_19055 [Litoreibacter sp.]|nr:hypothetical protein [Litoreibacter sp.]
MRTRRYTGSGDVFTKRAYGRKSVLKRNGAGPFGTLQRLAEGSAVVQRLEAIKSIAAMGAPVQLSRKREGNWRDRREENQRQKGRRKYDRQKGRDTRDAELPTNAGGLHDPTLTNRSEPEASLEDDPSEVWATEIEMTDAMAALKLLEADVDLSGRSSWVTKGKAGQHQKNHEALWGSLSERQRRTDEVYKVFKERIAATEQEVAYKASHTSSLSSLNKQIEVLKTLENYLFDYDETYRDIEEGYRAMIPGRARGGQGASPTKGAIAIKILPAPKTADVAGRFPGKNLSNALKIAADMINAPTSGNTGFSHSGPVYHSSSGSSVNSRAGTVFWTYAEDVVTIIAVGHHTGTQSNEYRITWKADGVNAPSVV